MLTIDIKDVYRWIEIMKNTDGLDRVKCYWRFSGALAILCHLGVITESEFDDFLDEFLENSAETGA